MTNMTDHEINEPQRTSRPLHSRSRDSGLSRLGSPNLIGRWGITAVVNVLVIAILAGALAFTLLRVNDQNSQNSLRNSALAAARTYGVFLSSYNYKNLNGPNSAWAEVESHATATFAKDFTNTSAALSKLLAQYNATATGVVVESGIETVSDSKAVALLFVDQTVTNTVQKPNSVTQPLRVKLTLLRQNGQWKIDRLEVPK